MRHALALLPLVLLLASACSSPCQDLGNRLCSCVPAGSSRDSCKKQIENQLKSVHPTEATEDLCDCLLGSCREPAGTLFCEWIQTDDGRLACGLTFPPTADRSAPPDSCYACPAGQTRTCSGTLCVCCPDDGQSPSPQLTCTGATIDTCACSGP